MNVRGYTNPNDGGGSLFNYISTIDKSTADGGRIFDPSVSLALQGTGVGLGCWSSQDADAINVRTYGAKCDGVTDDTGRVLAAALAAQTAGIDTLLIPGDTLVTTVDVKGCKLIGLNSTITGSVINCREYQDIIRNTKKQNYREFHPTIVPDKIPKALLNIDANTYYAFVEKETGDGYVLTKLINNITTTTDSLATTTSDITSFRSNGSLNCVDVLVGQRIHTAEQGVWTDGNLVIGVPTYDGGAEYQYMTAVGSVWREFSVPIGIDGTFSVTWQKSASNTTDAFVEVDGVSIDSGINLVEAAAELFTKTYTGFSNKTVTVRVGCLTNRTYIVGIDFSPLKDSVRTDGLDHIGYYRNSAINDYCISNSANDYAIYDKDAELWGGSYHGGESAIVTSFLLNNNSVSLSTGESVVGSSLKLKQSMTVDWSLSGGGSIDIKEEYTFLIGGYALDTNFKGSVNAESFFTTLYGSDESFTEVLNPEYVDLTAVSDGVRTPVNKAGHVSYSNTLNQKIKIWHSQYQDEEIGIGSAYVWKVIGSYNKYYYAPVDDGYRNITNISSINIYNFI